MKTLAILCLLLAIAADGKGQGYAWEFSPRFPMFMPTRFVGIEVSGSYAFHSASVLYVEDLLPCCTFKDGTGVPLRIVVTGEQWLNANLAVGAGLGVQLQSAVLTAPGDTLPVIDGNTVELMITEWELATSVTYASIEANSRLRLFTSALSVGVGLRGHIRITSQAQVIERIIQPEDAFFQDSQSNERVSATADFDQSALFVLEPALSLQYDVPLSTGLVLSPSILVSKPLTSLSSQQDWSYLALGFGVRISRGL